MFRRAVIALAFVVGACGASDGSSEELQSTATPPPTVPGVGGLPDTVPESPVADGGADIVPTASVVVTRPVDEDGVVVEAVAGRVNGNRLLVIGDSILASTATRYGDELCTALTPDGWTVEVDAEPGRFVEFGNEVLEERLPDGDDAGGDDDWDAAIVHLGSNYAEDQDEYFEELNEILFRLAPRPTLLMTVTQFRPAWVEVNESIVELARLYDNVTVVDWGKIARAPGVLSRDGLHPGDQGEDILVEQLSLALGAVGTTDGECLPSPFTDDSAVGGSSGSSSESSSGNSSSGSSSGGNGSSGGSSSGGSSGGNGSSSSGSSSGGSSGGGSSSSGSSSSGGSSSGGGSTSGSSGTTSGGSDTGADGTGTDGAGSDDSGTDGTGTDGTGTDGTGTGGTGSAGEDTGGDSGTEGTSTGGDTTDATTGGDSGTTGASTTGTDSGTGTGSGDGTGTGDGSTSTGGASSSGTDTGGAGDSSGSGDSTSGGSTTTGGGSGGSTSGSTSGGSTTTGGGSGGSTGTTSTGAGDSTGGTGVDAGAATTADDTTGD